MTDNEFSIHHDQWEDALKAVYDNVATNVAAIMDQVNDSLKAAFPGDVIEDHHEGDHVQDGAGEEPAYRPDGPLSRTASGWLSRARLWRQDAQTMDGIDQDVRTGEYEALATAARLVIEGRTRDELVGVAESAILIDRSMPAGMSRAYRVGVMSGWQRVIDDIDQLNRSARTRLDPPTP